MPFETIVLLVLKASLFLLVLGIGLHAEPGDAAYLFRRPGLLARSFLAMFVCMPLLAVVMTTAFALRPAVTVALVALSLSPVPPVLPIKADRADGSRSYIIGLFVAAALVAIVVVPLEVRLLGDFLGLPFQMAPVRVARLVGVSVLLPVSLGIVVRRVAPAIAARTAKPVVVVAAVVLVIAVIPVLIKVWPAMRALIGNGTLLAIVAMTIAGLVTGHLLGGRDDDNRTVLALATAARHPAVALAIVSTTVSASPAVTAAVLLNLVVGAIVSLPYMRWRRHENAA